MTEKIPTSFNSIDGNAQQNNEQNASVGKANEWKLPSQSGQSRVQTPEEKQRVKDVYKILKDIPKSPDSDPKLKELKQSYFESVRNPSSRTSGPSVT